MSDANLNQILSWEEFISDIARHMFECLTTKCDPHPFTHFSDIDLVVVGLWESLPLRTLERRLLERNIADPATIKVIIVMISSVRGGLAEPAWL